MNYGDDFYKNRFKCVEFGREHGEFGIREGENNTSELGNANLPEDNQGINEQDIDQEIVKLRPDTYALDTIMRTMPHKSVDAGSQIVDYYQQSNKPMVDTIDQSAHGSGSSAASPCSNYVCDEVGIGSIFIQVKTPKIWRKKDTLLMRKLVVNCNANGRMVVDGTDKTTHDQMFYVAQKSGAVLELVPVGGMTGAEGMVDKYIVPSFNATTTLHRMGSAMAEKDLTTEAFGIEPVPSKQYLQYFMCQVEETVFEKMTNKKIAYDLTDQEADAIYNMRGEIESSFLWGEKYWFQSSDGRTYFTEGIARQIEKSGRIFEYGNGSGDTTWTDAQIVELLRYIFTRNQGAKERVFFSGSGLIASLELFCLSNAAKQINMTSKVTEYYGVKCTQLYSTFGALNVIHHTMFDETEREYEGLVFDPQFIKKHTFKKMSATEVDFKSSGIKNVNAKVLSEVSGLTIRYPECHCIVRPRE